MKKKVLLITICLLVITGSLMYADQQKLKYSLVEVKVSGENEVIELLKKGFDVDVRFGIKRGSAQVIATLRDLEKLKDAGYSYTVIHDDLEEYNASRLYQPIERTLQIGSGSMGGYFTLEEVIAFIDSLYNEYPNLMSEPEIIGETLENRDILAYKISDNPETEEDEPEVLIIGMHHAREPMSIIAPLYYSQWLLENYESNELAAYLINERQIWFVPLLNPDGYAYNQQCAPNGGGMWRKNMQDNNNNGVFNPDYDGVDLNRNYGFEWGYDDVGSSPDPSSETYRGTEAFSELETSAIRALCIEHEFKTSLSFHTFGDLLIYSEYADGTPFEDTELMRDYAKDMIIENGYTYGNGTETVNYVTNGDSDAWLYGEQTEKPKIMAYTPEIGDANDYFWAPTSRIIPLAEENLFMQQYICLVAGDFLKAVDHRFVEIEGDFDYAPEPNETISFFVSLKNLSYDSNIQNLNVEITTYNTDITMLQDQWSIAQINALQTEEAHFEFDIGGAAQSGDTVVFTLHCTADNGYELSLDYEIILGSPFMIFYDNAENGTENWVTGLDWGVTDERSSEGACSFSDSPYSNYSDFAENYFTILSGIDLSNINSAFLKFNARWDLERHYDKVQVSFITNSITDWQVEAGIHTTGGTGVGVQTFGEPVYNGFRDLAWFKESYQLTDYLDSGFKFRFSLSSDEAVNDDGFYTDEIQILCYTDHLMPPVLNQVTGQTENTADNGPFEIFAIAGDAQGIAEVNIKYNISDGELLSIPMEISELMHFSGEIPFVDYGEVVSYYVEVRDEEENIVLSNPVTFLVTDSYPVIAVEPESISFILTEDEEMAIDIITIGNSGFIPLHYTISEREPEMIRNPDNKSDKKRNSLKRDINQIITNGFTAKKLMINSLNRTGRELIEILTDENDIDTVGYPDFLSLSAEVTDTHLNLQMIVEENSSWGQTLGIISFDIDQDVNTGVYPCGLGAGTDLYEIGSEFEIVWDPGSVTGNGVVVLVLDGAGEVFYGMMAIDVNGNVTSTSIPLYIFDDDMNINLAVTMYNVYTEERDFAPESGYAVLGSAMPLSWISEDPTFGTVAYNETGVVAISVTSQHMDFGTYEAEIVIESNDPLNPEIVVPVTMVYNPVGFDDENSFPIQANLYQNYPNPFNPSTTISFSLTAKNAKSAKLEIFNIKGQKIKDLSQSLCQPELYPLGRTVEGREKISVTWNGTDNNNKPVGSGIYFYQLNVNGKTEAVKKCLLLK